MKLTTNCQICGQILSVVENTTFSSEDIADYEANSYCNTVTNGTVDGQQAIQSSVTVN